MRSTWCGAASNWRPSGLALNLHLARPVNTFDAHRLIHLGGAHGLADEVAERLLHGYHTEGLNIVECLGTEAGLASADVRALLAGDAHADGVRGDERRAARLGITSVPRWSSTVAPPCPVFSRPMSFAG